MDGTVVPGQGNAGFAVDWDARLTPGGIAGLAPGTLYSLAGKVAVVTGGAGGIGRWLAAGLGGAGATVALVDVDQAAMGAAMTGLTSAGVTVEPLVSDLVAPDAPSRVVNHVVERCGRIDVLINCAAVNRRQPITDVDPETFDQILGLDLRVPYFLSQAAARAMAAGGSGSIVNIGSINCAVGLQDVSVYGIAKAGLMQLTRVMAVEWANDGIRANCLAPGFMATPLSRPVWEDPVRARWMLERIPLRRPGRAEELVGLCLLLASDAGSYITGQTFYVDGGFLAGSPWSATGETGRTER